MVEAARIGRISKILVEASDSVAIIHDVQWTRDVGCTHRGLYVRQRNSFGPEAVLLLERQSTLPTAGTRNSEVIVAM